MLNEHARGSFKSANVEDTRLLMNIHAMSVRLPILAAKFTVVCCRPCSFYLGVDVFFVRASSQQSAEYIEPCYDGHKLCQPSRFLGHQHVFLVGTLILPFM